MVIQLARQGKVFASRERAREVISAELRDECPCVVEVDFGGAYANPSFVGELLHVLANRTDRIVVTGMNEHTHRLVTSLAEKLSLADKVTVDPPLVTT